MCKSARATRGRRITEKANNYASQSFQNNFHFMNSTEIVPVCSWHHLQGLDVLVMGRRRSAERWWIIWFRRNHLPFSVNMTRETVANLRRKRTAAQPIFILGQDDDVLEECKYLSSTLTTSWPTHRLYMRKLCFLKNQRSFNMCSKCALLWSSGGSSITVWINWPQTGHLINCYPAGNPEPLHHLVGR